MMHNGLGGGHGKTVGLPAGSGWAIVVNEKTKFPNHGESLNILSLAAVSTWTGGGYNHSYSL